MQSVIAGEDSGVDVEPSSGAATNHHEESSEGNHLSAALIVDGRKVWFAFVSSRRSLVPSPNMVMLSAV